MFLRRDAALYTTTRVKLAVATARAAAGPVQAFGMGGEFRYAPGTANYVGIRARRGLAVDAIAASVSAAPVSGAPADAHWGTPPPADAHWGTPPHGPWQVTTDFLYLPAPACNAAHLAGHQPGADYDVLRLADPVALPRPPGAVTLLSIPLASRGAQASQATLFKGFTDRTLNPGDCLIAFAGVAAGGAGVLDVENQSTVYLRAGGMR